MDNNQLTKAAASLAVAGAFFGGIAAYAAAQEATSTVEPEAVESEAVESDVTANAETDESTNRGDYRERGMRGGMHGGGAEMADLLGITTDELRAALGAGQSLAEVAEANGVDVDAVIDAIVEKYNERIDDAVANGRLTEDEATDLRGQVVDHVTAEVNGEHADRLEGLGPDGKGRRGEHRFGRDADGSSEDTDTATVPSSTKGEDV